MFWAKMVFSVLVIILTCLCDQQAIWCTRGRRGLTSLPGGYWRSIQDGFSCGHWGSAPCGPLSSRLAKECSHCDGRRSRGKPQCASPVQASACMSGNISVVKASHLPEARVKEWAGHPYDSEKAKLQFGYREQWTIEAINASFCRYVWPWQTNKYKKQLFSK